MTVFYFWMFGGSQLTLMMRRQISTAGNSSRSEAELATCAVSTWRHATPISGVCRDACSSNVLHGRGWLFLLLYCAFFGSLRQFGIQLRPYQHRKSRPVTTTPSERYPLPGFR